MDKEYANAYALIESMTQNHYQWGSERTQSEKTSEEKSSTKSGMYEISNLDRVNAKVDALTQKIENLTIAPVAAVAAVSPNCEIRGMSGYAAPECHLLAGVSPEPVNYAQIIPYSNTYNPGWKNHPNFSCKNNNALYTPGQAPSVPPGYQKAPFAAPDVPRKSNLELMMEKFHSHSNSD
ncbi:uncharacterized protein LOC131639782 [Vicia villosa]|uniref:uncharacterized protein LOC131639782 n=1 Tax=Vicia villosa TaxID=3911 RepID=UPI00273B4715|nr:uncharacterized protein LOC131639782 [Vicia villosa]